MFQILFAFGMNLLGEVIMILSLSGIFNSTIDYYSVGGSVKNKAYYAETGTFNPDIP
jgi:hypothetical protein